MIPGDKPMERGHDYYVYGKYCQGMTAYPYAAVCELENPGAKEAGIDVSEESMIVDVTDMTPEEEAIIREKVCIVSKFMAKTLGCSLGDSITLKKSYVIDSTIDNSYWVDRGYESENQYIIVGLFDGQLEYRCEVFCS